MTGRSYQSPAVAAWAESTRHHMGCQCLDRHWLPVEPGRGRQWWKCWTATI